MRFGGLIVAIVLAALAAIIVLRTSTAPAPAVPGSPMASESAKSVAIYIAAKEIAVGTQITADMITSQAWPEHLVLDGFVKADDKSNIVVGTIARGTFQAQEPIISGKLANANDPNFLAGELPKGMRVITVATNETDGLAGFLFPGDYVDILFTHDVDVGAVGKTKPVTETLLANVKVLAVDQRSSSAGATDKDGKLLIPRSVSLMVTLPDAQRLRLGVKAGTLTLALRSLADRDVSDPLTITSVGDISLYKQGGASDDTQDGGVRVLRGAPGDVRETMNDAGATRLRVPAYPHSITPTR